MDGATFRDAVVEATKRATQEVAARNRRRLRLETILIAIVLVAPISIFTTLVVTKANQGANCRLITSLATLGAKRVEREIAETRRFERESADRFGLTQKRFEELVREQHESERHAQAVTEGVAHHSCG